MPTLFQNLRITRSHIRPHTKWAVSLVIAYIQVLQILLAIVSQRPHWPGTPHLIIQHVIDLFKILLVLADPHGFYYLLEVSKHCMGEFLIDLVQLLISVYWRRGRGRASPEKININILSNSRSDFPVLIKKHVFICMISFCIFSKLLWGRPLAHLVAR